MREVTNHIELVLIHHPIWLVASLTYTIFFEKPPTLVEQDDQIDCNIHSAWFSSSEPSLNNPTQTCAFSLWLWGVPSNFSFEPSP